MSGRGRGRGRPRKVVSDEKKQVVYSPALLSDAARHTVTLFDTPHTCAVKLPPFFRGKPVACGRLKYSFNERETMMLAHPWCTTLAQFIDLTNARMNVRRPILHTSVAAIEKIQNSPLPLVPMAQAVSSSSSKRPSDGDEPPVKRVAPPEIEVVDAVLTRITRDFDSALLKSEGTAVKAHALDCFLLETMCAQLLERPPGAASAVDVIARVSVWIERYRTISSVVTLNMSEEETLDYKRNMEQKRETAGRILASVRRHVHAACAVIDKDLAALDAVGKVSEPIDARVDSVRKIRAAMDELLRSEL